MSKAIHIGWLETKPRTKVFVGEAPPGPIASLWLGGGNRKTNWLVIEEPRPSFYCNTEGVREWPEFTPLDDGPTGETADALRREGCVWGGVYEGALIWERHDPSDLSHLVSRRVFCGREAKALMVIDRHKGKHCIVWPEVGARMRESGLLTRGEPEASNRCHVCKTPDATGCECDQSPFGDGDGAPTYPGLTYVGTACGWRVHVGDGEAQRRAWFEDEMPKGDTPDSWEHDGVSGRSFRDGGDGQGRLSVSPAVLAVMDQWVNWVERVRDYNKPETWGNKTREEMEDPSTMAKPYTRAMVEEAQAAAKPLHAMQKEHVAAAHAEAMDAIRDTPIPVPTESDVRGRVAEAFKREFGGSPGEATETVAKVVADMAVAQNEQFSKTLDNIGYHTNRKKNWGDMQTPRESKGGPILICGDPGHVTLHLENLSDDREKAMKQLMEATEEMRRNLGDRYPLIARGATLNVKLDLARGAIRDGWKLKLYLQAIRDAHAAIGVEREWQEGKVKHCEGMETLVEQPEELLVSVAVEGQAGPGWPKR